MAWILAGPSLGQVQATDRIYTSKQDFALGELYRVNSWFGSGQLELDLAYDSRPRHPFMWIALRGWGAGAMILVATETNPPDYPDHPMTEGQILGIYRTAPDGMYKAPSRTAVDSRGNVWVANGAEPHPWLSDPMKGSITKVVNRFTDPGGCRNGGANTSQNIDDLKDWLNPGWVDSLGGVSSADDDCIVAYVRTTAREVHSLAIQSVKEQGVKREYLWVGGIQGALLHEKYDAETGAHAGGPYYFHCGGSQGLFANGVLWSSSPGTLHELLRYDTRGGYQCIPFDRETAGLAVDPEGYIWVANYSANTVTKLAPDGGARTFHETWWPMWDMGVAATWAGEVWVADMWDGYVSRLDSAGDLTGYYHVGSRPNGVAEDRKGDIWVSVGYDAWLNRIDPEDHSVARYEIGPWTQPVNLGGMTNSVIRTTAVDLGTWTVLQDSGREGQSWGTITWNTEPYALPAGTGIMVEVRAADAIEDLESAAWIEVDNGQRFSESGRYLEVNVILWPDADGTTPVLTDIRLETSTDVDGDGFASPDDCDDGDADTHPGAPEICDGEDNDCDGLVPADEQDADGDGVASCAGDCDDANATIYPQAPEICDGLDNDCDGDVDEGFDQDGDNVADCFDNCPAAPNADQTDSDGDGAGDACDACPFDAENDADGDGVCGDVDQCAGTAFSDPDAGVPSQRLGRNRWAEMDGDGELDTDGNNPTGRTFTMDSTGGCNCAQIIDACGYGQGHVKFGCSNSVMDWWTGLYDRAGEAPFQCEG